MQARGFAAFLAVSVAVAAAPGSESRASGGQFTKAGAGRTWDRIWSDSFDGPAGAPPNARKWKYDVGGWGWGSHQAQTYTTNPGNVSLDGRGKLAITARRQTHTGPDGFTREYTSGRLKTERLFSVRYGRIAARIKVPAGQGIWPTFWMLGADIRRVGFPECGEIDIMELRGQEPDVLYGSVHGPGPNGENIGPSVVLDRPGSLAKRFHTYEVRWSRRAVRFRLDGKGYGNIHRAVYPRGAKWVYDHRMFMLLNVAVGGGWSGYPDASTRFPATMKVQWVRVWKRRR